MALDKLSKKSDAVANLYRASLFLAKGSKDLGINFLKKAQIVLGDEIDGNLTDLITKEKKLLKSNKDNLFWAEKILDKYHSLI